MSSLGIQDTQIFFNEKVDLNSILTNQFQMYLFPTFIISKVLKFCGWFTINPIEGSIVSKLNLSKIWIYFLTFLWKIVFFFNLIFFELFLIYFIMFSPFMEVQFIGKVVDNL
jgi:hypothetical protein